MYNNSSSNSKNLLNNQKTNKKQYIQVAQKPVLMKPTVMPNHVNYVSNVRPIVQSFFNPQQSYISGYNKHLKNQIYNDDEKIEQESLTNTFNENDQVKIHLDLKTQRSQIRIGQSAIIPGLCQFLTTGGMRTYADIICVIDQSGSMSGQKIQLVRQTMKYVLDLLTPNDRLSIIVYQNEGQRVTPLRCTNAQNFPYFDNIIKNLRAGGGNIMINGLQVALKVIRQRKYRNQATAVFLLSDGQQPKDTAKNLLNRINLPQNTELGSFSIHSFGFGADHDEDVMSSVSAIKDGNFYYIKDLQTLDEAFVNALGGIMTQTASEVQLQIQNVSSGFAQDIQISRVYGDKWEKINQKTYKIRLNQVMSEISKNFVFQLNVPKLKAEFIDINRQMSVIKGSYRIKDINGKIITGQTLLSLILIGQYEPFKVQQNAKVLEEYFRLIAVESMEKCRQKAEQGQYNEAQKEIDNMLETIKTNPVVRKEKMKNLIHDLQMVKINCNPQIYNFDGRKNIVNSSYNHKNQNNFAYSNKVQINLQTQLLQQKPQKKA